ncbi:MAG TPA: hypothetical protein VJB98_02220 [Candidatus Paceibacterota bacterium]
MGIENVESWAEELEPEVEVAVPEKIDYKKGTVDIVELRAASAWALRNGVTGAKGQALVELWKAAGGSIGQGKKAA